MEARIHVYLRGDVLQRMRLGSGLILFAFAAAHFLNHAVGLISLEAMHEVQAWRLLITRSPLVTIVLLLALLTHVGLGLYKLAHRGTLRMPWWEMLQIAIALGIPFLLLPHIVDTRVSNWVYRVENSYLSELYYLWPDRAITQTLLLLLVWAHSCIGLHYWLRTAEGYTKIAPVLLIPAIGVPALAIAGFVAAGQQTAEIMSQPEALARLSEQDHWLNAADSLTMADLKTKLLWGFAGLLGIVGAIYAGRNYPYRNVPRAAGGPDRRRRTAPHEPVIISYHDGPTVEAKPGMTLLEISRSAGIPHASICGGRSRCGTCRVRIAHGIEALPAPRPAEAATLRSLDATGSTSRLACQIRPIGPLAVEVLVRPDTLSLDPVEFFEVKDLVAAHARAIDAGALVDVAAGDKEDLKTWQNGQLDSLISAKPMPGDRFEFLGVRVDYLRDRPASAFAYKGFERIISLFVVPSHRDDALAISGSRGAYAVLGWSDDRHNFYAVSDLGRADLERFEEWAQGRSTRRSDTIAAQSDQ
jgi:adenylate cyclase